MGQTGKVRSIHYLRAIAAAMVVVMHIYNYGLVTGHAANPVYWMKHGVSIFFVISGFVMVVSTREWAGNGRDFLRRRLIRIVPLYWLATLALFAFGLTQPGDFDRLLPSLLLVPTLANQARDVTSPVLEVGWTLCLEMAFYTLFAAAMILPRKTAILGTAAVLCLAGVLAQTLPGTPWTRFYLSPLIAEFGGGMVIAWFGLRAPGWVCPLGFLALATLGDAGLGHTLGVSVPTLMIVTGGRGLDGRLPAIPVLDRMGDASYATYLWHLHAMNLVIVPLLGAAAPELVVVPATLLVTLLVGDLAHRRIEAPLTGWLARRSRRQAPVLAPA